MRAAISAIEYYLPEEVLTTAQLAAEFPEWSVEKIDATTGIGARHIAGRMPLKGRVRIFPGEL
jgi:3-oxoacyl-[acyl-carrier-protein] synthase III